MQANFIYSSHFLEKFDLMLTALLLILQSGKELILKGEIAIYQHMDAL